MSAKRVAQRGSEPHNRRSDEVVSRATLERSEPVMASEPVDFGEQCLYRELGYALQHHDRCLSGVLATFTQSHWLDCLLPHQQPAGRRCAVPAGHHWCIPECKKELDDLQRRRARQPSSRSPTVRSARQAVEEVWPKTRGQRCCVHNTANVLNKLPNSRHPKKDALAAFDAFSR
jgi:hypothetical protein